MAGSLSVPGSFPGSWPWENGSNNGNGRQQARGSYRVPQIRKQDFVIAVMGVTGSGKSTFINYLSDSEVPIGHSLESCTNEVKIYPCQLPDSQGRRLFLVDSPGFNDTYKSDTDILRDIAAWLNEAYTNKILLTGIVYLHRISDTRLGGSGMKNLRMFKKLCGTDSLASVVLATTMWDTVQESEGRRRESDLRSRNDFWKDMIDKGSEVLRHDRQIKSAVDIVRHLIVSNKRVTLDIQAEMVDRGISLDQTAAGQEVQAELAKARAEYERHLRLFEKEMKEAISQKDRETQKEIREMRAKVERQIRESDEAYKRLQADKNQLQAEFSKQKAEHKRAMQRLEAREQELMRKDESYRINQKQKEKMLEEERAWEEQWIIRPCDDPAKSAASWANYYSCRAKFDKQQAEKFSALAIEYR